MIAINFGQAVPSFPVTVVKFLQFFGELCESKGTSYKTDTRMFTAKRDIITFEQTFDSHVEYLHDVERSGDLCSDSIVFDLAKIDNAMACEFVEVPDEISNADDFHNWLMEMKFE